MRDIVTGGGCQLHTEGEEEDQSTHRGKVYAFFIHRPFHLLFKGLGEILNF